MTDSRDKTPKKIIPSRPAGREDNSNSDIEPTVVRALDQGEATSNSETDPTLVRSTDKEEGNSNSDADPTLVQSPDQTAAQSNSDAEPTFVQSADQREANSNSDADPTLVQSASLEVAANYDAAALTTMLVNSPESVAARANIPPELLIKDRFVLESRLGKGGQGQIFKAIDLRKQEAEDADPYVAIKFLGEEFSRHPRALISLQREAKKSQQLAHPNVLTVYDFDREGDRVFMTMEFLDGASLNHWRELEYSGEKPTVESLVLQMASGLAYAHKSGVVHSDFKPDNVVVTRDGRAKILDFGIARIMGSAAEEDSFDAGELGALTPRYASLEMLQGGHEPDPSDDLYALGLIAYKLYTGVHPYNDLNAVDALEAGLKPAPIKGLARHRWRAINHALQLKRSHRTLTAVQFTKEFTGISRRNKLLLGLVVMLALSSAFLAFKAGEREGPAIPFDELPIAVQQQVSESLEMGQKSAAIEDWDGASRYFLAAYELHPRNEEAEAGLEQLANQLVAVGQTTTNPRQRQYLLQMIQGYGDNEYLAAHEGLAALRLQLEGESLP